MEVTDVFPLQYYWPFHGRHGGEKCVQTLEISLDRRIDMQYFTLILRNSNDILSTPWPHKVNNSGTTNLLLILIRLQFYPLLLSAGHRRHASLWFVVVVFVVFSWYYWRHPVSLIKVISLNNLRCESRHASAGIKLLSQLCLSLQQIIANRSSFITSRNSSHPYIWKRTHCFNRAVVLMGWDVEKVLCLTVGGGKW